MANHRRKPCHLHRDRLPLLPLFRGLRRSHFFTDHLDWFVFVIAHGWCDKSDVGGDHLFALWAAPGLFVHQIAKICFAIHCATGDATPLPACLYR
jgi:hypothetical protein